MAPILLLALATGQLSTPAVAAGSLPSMDSELRAAVGWLEARIADGTLTEHDALFRRFFTTYAVPARLDNAVEVNDAGSTLRGKTPAVLSFVLNSLADPGVDGPPVRPLPVSDTLYTIDLRDYGWDGPRFEAALRTEPYAVEPLVDHGVYNAGRRYSSNLLVRADWFVVHATDTLRQKDLGLGEADFIYYTLIYGVGKAPRTLGDFQRTWGADRALATRFKADFNTVLRKQASGVSRGSRRIVAFRTVLGDYWETRDSALANYLENLLDDDFQAKEAITNNARGLQVYLLVNDKEERVEDGDLKLVRNDSDPGDPRVRTASTCIVCHPIGINDSQNALRDLIRGGVGLHDKYKAEARRLERLYLAGTFDRTFVAANRRYADAVYQANGLSPAENAIAYKALYDWYSAPLPLDQAAIECGLSADAYRRALAATASGELAGLVTLVAPPVALDRQFWEVSIVGGRRVGGAYAESILHIKGRTAEPAVLVPAALVAAAAPTAVVLAADAAVMSGRVTLFTLPAGATVEYGGTSGGWTRIVHDGRTGFVRSDLCRPVR